MLSQLQVKSTDTQRISVSHIQSTLSPPKDTLHKAKGLVHAVNKFSGNVSKYTPALEEISDILATSFQTKSYMKSQYVLCAGLKMGKREWKTLNGDSFLSFLFPYHPMTVRKTILRNYDNHSWETTNLVKYPHVKGEVTEILRDYSYWQSWNLNEDLMND